MGLDEEQIKQVEAMKAFAEFQQGHNHVHTEDEVVPLPEAWNWAYGIDRFGCPTAKRTKKEEPMNLDEMIAKKEKLMEEYRALPAYKPPTKVSDADETYFVCKKCQSEVQHNIHYVKNYGTRIDIEAIIGESMYGESMYMVCQACGYDHYERIE